MPKTSLRRSEISYNIGLVMGGAVPPILGGVITASFGAFTFGVFVAALCLVSLLSALGLPETRQRDLMDSSKFER